MPDELKPARDAGERKRETCQHQRAANGAQGRAPQPEQEIALPVGAPYGRVNVDTGKCTLCMACTGACPALPPPPTGACCVTAAGATTCSVLT